MRAYFAILFFLIFAALFLSYRIATTLTFDKLDNQLSTSSKAAFDNNGTSDCFEKRYSPQIQACGGLLKYSLPQAASRVEKDKKQHLAVKHKRSNRQVAASKRSNTAAGALGNFKHIADAPSF